MSAVTAEVTAHKVKRARAGRRQPAREDSVRARRAAEGAGPQGRPENAMPNLDTCHLRGSKQKHRVGQGCCKGTQATGLKNSGEEEHEQNGEPHPICCFLKMCPG